MVPVEVKNNKISNFQHKFYSICLLPGTVASETVDLIVAVVLESMDDHLVSLVVGSVSEIVESVVVYELPAVYVPVAALMVPVNIRNIEISNF